jgi:putative addiction module killer protein
MGMKARVLKKHVTENGICPFDRWLDRLRDKRSQAIILTRLNRLIQGNFGHCRVLGGGLTELKIDYGPGFRVYFAEDGDTLVVLLLGGDKSTQKADIDKARTYLEEYLESKE